MRLRRFEKLLPNQIEGSLDPCLIIFLDISLSSVNAFARKLKRLLWSLANLGRRPFDPSRLMFRKRIDLISGLPRRAEASWAGFGSLCRPMCLTSSSSRCAFKTKQSLTRWLSR